MTAEAMTNNTSWEPIRLSHVKPTFTSLEHSLAAREDLWHKFIIYNSDRHEKHEILKAVVTTCEPKVLIPIMYRDESVNKGTFLARCCASAIENLVKQGLTITLIGGQDVCMDIILGFIDSQELQINPNRVIAQALCYRYDPLKKILNLDDFENEKALGSIYCPISIPKVFQFVLRCTKMGIIGNNRDSRLPIRDLSLKYNKITAIILFEKFFNYHLTKLDLRHNQILDVEYLRYFSEHKIIELWLDGNPLCSKYTSPEDYVQAVKSVFPHLQKLDGVVIDVGKRCIPTVQNNFLGNGSKLWLIKQFIRHFFTLYDQEDRIVMNGLYDKKAFYSMSLGTVTNSIHKRLTKAFSTNRNLLKFVDYAKCQEFLLQGNERIISALRRQPPTVHNFKTFHIDLLHEGENHIAISVQGCFWYRDAFCPPMLFNRSFIIVKKEDNEYCITNDQYYIDGSPANSTAVTANEIKCETKAIPRFTPTTLSVSEKEQLFTFLHELTTMNRMFCEKFLEDSSWDIRGAITRFMQMYTINDIPPEAFY